MKQGKIITWCLMAAGLVVMLCALAIHDDAVAFAALFTGFAALVAGIFMNERMLGTVQQHRRWPE